MSAHKRVCFTAVVSLVMLSPPFRECPGQESHAEATIPKASASSPLAALLITDCGVDMDDQWVLAHLLLSPEVDLRAVIPTHASINFPSDSSAHCVADVLAHVLPANASPRPLVMSGSDVPLHDARTPQGNPGVDLLLRLSRNFSASRRLVVFSTGAATDVASAILEDPTIAQRVGVVAMGWADWPNGGEEFNIRNDPVAWEVILHSDVPLVIGSAAVTKRGLRLTQAEAASLMRTHGPVGQYLDSLFDRWVDQHPDLAARVVAPATWVVWDEVVIAYALGLASGDEVPRPQLKASFSFSHPETSQRILWLTQIETEKVWRDLTTKIDARDPSKKRP